MPACERVYGRFVHSFGRNAVSLLKTTKALQGISVSEVLDPAMRVKNVPAVSSARLS